MDRRALDPVGSATAVDADPMTRRTALLIAAAAAFGVALRIKVLLDARSLWMDEALLTMNLCSRDLKELWGPLEFDQVAPYGFLALEWMALRAFGPGEVAFRLTPFLASLATLFLATRFCLVNFGARAAAFGILLTAVLPSLVYYGAEVKQYGLDVAVGLLILDLGAVVLRGGLTGLRAAVLAVVGSVALWFSHPAAFMLAGVGSTLIALEIARRDRAATLMMVGVSACWAASFLAEYNLMLRDTQSNASLQEFWKFGYLPFPPDGPSDLREYLSVFLGLFDTAFQDLLIADGTGLRMALAAVMAWLVGVVTLARDGRRGMLALLLMPLGFALAASMTRVYPLRGRLALFTVGPDLILIAVAIGSILRSPHEGVRRIGTIFGACLLAHPTYQAVQKIGSGSAPRGLPGLIAKIDRDWRPGDLLYVDFSVAPQFQYYRTYGGERLDRVAPDRIIEDVAIDTRDPEDLARLIGRLRGRPRVWMLFAEHGNRRGIEARIEYALKFAGERLDSMSSEGSYVGLFRFGPAIDLDRSRVDEPTAPPHSGAAGTGKHVESNSESSGLDSSIRGGPSPLELRWR